MGVQKFKRPILAPGGQITSATTFTANIVQSTGSRLVEHVQSLAGTDTGTNVTNYGLTYITVESSANGTAAATLPFKLAAPIAGVTKTIIVDNNSTKIIQVRTLTSAATFYGSTKNALQWSTGSTEPPAAIELIGLSTSQWALKTYVPASTAAAAPIAVAGATA